MIKFFVFYDVLLNTSELKFDSKKDEKSLLKKMKLKSSRPNSNSSSEKYRIAF